MRIAETFEGPRLSEKVPPSNADWVLLGDDGADYLDIRINPETQNVAHIYVQYYGVLGVC